MRLVCGIEIGGVWYNHASLRSIDEIKKRIFDVFDNAEMTTARIVEELCKITIDKIYPHEIGEPEKPRMEEGINITPAQILDLKFYEGWIIGFETMKALKNNEFFAFPESFRCDRCSQYQDTFVTKIESWQKLIDDGILEITYLYSPEEIRWKHELPVPVEMSDKGSKRGTEIFEIEREYLSIQQMKQIQSDPELNASPMKKIYAYIDQSISSIPGFSRSDLNIYVKRNLHDSFTAKYLSHYDNIDELQNAPKVGFDGSYRHVACEKCGAELGRSVSGGLDFTNFFDFLVPRKSNRNLMAQM